MQEISPLSIAASPQAGQADGATQFDTLRVSVRQGMRGKTVVITGGTSGIGAAAAGSLLHEGTRIVVASHDVSRLDHHSDKISAYPLDVSREKSVMDFFTGWMRRVWPLIIWLIAPD